MFSLQHKPKEMPGEILDDYLANGWFRYGQKIFTCSFLLRRGDLFSVLWARVNLKDFKFRAGQRKLMRKIDKNFVVEIKPLEITTQKEQLFEIYKQEFDGFLGRFNLKETLLEDNEKDIFNSWEINIYDYDELIAFSTFDIGENSIESINAVYHPDYKNFSLGYYTMLLEVQHSISLGLEYYYPGYIVPGYNRFDYKKRIGPMQYFESKSKHWLKLENPNSITLLHEHLINKLRILQRQLGKRGIPTKLWIYPVYEVSFWNLDKDIDLGFPLLLQVYPKFYDDRYLVFVFDPYTDQYRFIPCLPTKDITFLVQEHINTDAKIELLTHLLVMVDNLVVTDDPKEAIQRMKLWMSRSMFV